MGEESGEKKAGPGASEVDHMFLELQGKTTMLSTFSKCS
jgi:hypothetical protein